jgi:hypothetical protein
LGDKESPYAKRGREKLEQPETGDEDKGIDVATN